MATDQAPSGARKSPFAAACAEAQAKIWTLRHGTDDYGRADPTVALALLLGPLSSFAAKILIDHAGARIALARLVIAAMEIAHGFYWDIGEDIVQQVKAEALQRRESK